MQLAISGEETPQWNGVRHAPSRAAAWMRIALRCFGLAALVLLMADGAWAQGSDWPPFPMPESPTEFKQVRGEGYYLSMLKISAFLFVFFLWVKTTDWVNQDCQKLRLNYGVWNAVVVAVFFAAVLVMWVLPWFVVGYLLLLVAYAVPLGMYIAERNKHVSDDKKALTKAHLRLMLASVVNKFGGKMEVEKRAAHEMGPDVKFTAQGGADPQVDQSNMILARQMTEGYIAAKEMLDQAVKMRAEQFMLEYTAASVAVKFQIDGLWHNHTPLEREKGDPMLAVFKLLCNLKPADRVAKQSGKFSAEVDKKKLACRFQSQGTPSGEAAVVAFEQKKLSFANFDELGMRGKMQEQIKELLSRKNSFIIVSAMPAGGLTTTFDVLMLTTDRFMRNFVGIEDEAKHEREIENIAMTRFDSRKGENPMTVLPKLIRTYPDVYVVRDMVNGETVDTLSGQVVDEQRAVFTSVRAKEGVEALLRVLALRAAPDRFAEAVTAVLNVRLVRKLCEKCKEAYAPPPEVLKQLGLPPGKVQALYRPPVPPPPGSEEAKQYKPCEECMAIGYLGRTAIFELVIVDDGMRQVLAKQPKLDLLREASRRAGNRNLQEEGVLLVARGVTSVPELIRVLKQ